MTGVSLYFPNYPSRRRISICGTDVATHFIDNCEMPNDQPNWYLQDWMRHFGKIQADLTKELGWDKSRANFLFHGKQPYKRERLNEAANWLGIEPYELLMPPEKALAIRELYKTAERIVQGRAPGIINPEGEHFLPGAQPPRLKGGRTGTGG